MKMKKLLAFIFYCCTYDVYASNYVMRNNDGVEHSLDSLFNENNIPHFEQLFKKHDVKNHRDLLLETQHGTRVRGRLYGQGHQTLIVLCLGMGSTFKECEHHAEYLVSDYDVLIFEYRWQPLNKKELIMHTANIFFTDNHEEVIAAAHLGRSLGYQNIIGLGECYSGFMFPKAQALCERGGEKLFDKLIIDSGMVSLENYIRSIIIDPCLAYNPLTGGFPNWLKPCTRLLCALLNRPINYLYRDAQCPIDVMRYLPHITVPILFIRGKSDPSISWEDFERAWNSVRAPKTAFITPFHHSNSFQHVGRPFYLYTLQHFINDNLQSLAEKINC